MGRFEKQPDNPRVRSDLSRAAENALWAVVEDLENLQQHILRSLQEEVKQLQGEKTRLNDDIQRLLDEKEQLQQVKQITEQQVLIRQLAEALAKHISSHLQSSLTTIASEAIEKNSYQSLNPAAENNDNVEQMLSSLDNSLTNTFNLLQQELKNYQSNLSQQLYRMEGQQQQGESIIAELISRLQGLEKTIAETSVKTQPLSPPTVLQVEVPPTVISPPTVIQLPPAPSQMTGENSANSQQNSITSEIPENNTAPLEVTVLPEREIVSEPVSVIVPESSAKETFSSKENEPLSVLVPEISQNEPTAEPTSALVNSNESEPLSVIVPEISQNEPTPEPTSALVNTNESEPLSVIVPEISQNEPTAEPTSALINSNESEPISVIVPELAASETTPEPIAEKEATSTTFNSNNSEPISVLSPELSANETAPEPIIPLPEATPPPVSKNQEQPISLTSRDESLRKTPTETTLSTRKQGLAAPSLPLTSSANLSSIQIGFLLIVLSTAASALYNVAIKVIFQQNSEILGLVQVERLLLPTLGNVLLILMLRLLVVVPLMLLLAPMMHPRVWEDLQTLFTSLGKDSSPTKSKTLKVLQFSIASGCFLFLSQVLIYIAISQVTTGMAIALFFIYPVISGLLSWFLFRDRPNKFRNAAIGALFCGELLILGGASGVGNVSLGSTTAILSGFAFAVYVILTRICASKLHPVSFTVINFTTMLLLSVIGLIIPFPGDLSLNFQPARLLEVILCAFILGVLTLFGYICNNVGIRQLGAPRSAIIGASVPFLTVIFAGLLIQENLELVQILGVLLVTFGAAAFSFEKMRNQVNSNSQT
ncbi:EamA family transporter [Calothrix sp. FACHB-1219]|uniref:EamA family transporter n=1 Tax=unclassified Calothrix TaxID=2619626 RepID=UPI0016828FA0|nr:MULTISPECIES: EamA family transporter [unclassified Calothrix]MBD2202317.1 EamA family transporter [Calothrix sp. FACHB-168]MBD2217723.1 EamA family transporter [Calothrix sp. FACHB-1219]